MLKREGTWKVLAPWPALEKHLGGKIVSALGGHCGQQGREDAPPVALANQATGVVAHGSIRLALGEGAPCCGEQLAERKLRGDGPHLAVDSQTVGGFSPQLDGVVEVELHHHIEQRWVWGVVWVCRWM